MSDGEEKKVESESPPSSTGENHQTEERRLYPRRQRTLHVHLAHVATPETKFSGWVVDHSAGGLRINVDQPLEVGTHLLVRSTVADKSTPWVEVRVQSVRPRDATWDLGCEFVRSPTWAALMQFG
ncbi:MAG: hypothetical protein KatS3mg105_1393 [Gemmatales bacterium]|nr:MAG: hypothetical protein KatS3mg105_1393 [Gemmatales bacterium]